MKKIFTLIAATLVSFGLWAETETVPKASDNWTGNSVAISNSECANGDKSIIKDGESEASYFVKFRTNKNGNTLTLTVQPGIKVTGVSMRAYANNKTATISLSGVSYDGVAESPFSAVAFPGNDAGTTATYSKVSLEATQSVVFAFDNSQVNPDDNNNKNAQIMAILTITYEVTATTYKATYKSNLAGVADVVDNMALKVKGNPFKEPKDKFFVGWNTKADGTGAAVAVETMLTQDTTLFAQWEAFDPCIAMSIDSGTVDPALNVEVALKTGSYGGKIIFVGAKDDNYAASFIYKKGGGLQLSKGAADSLRVELPNDFLIEGSVIRLELIAANDGKPAINLIPIGKPAMLQECNLNVAKTDTVSVYYKVKADDGLVNATKFILGRGSSTVILNAVEIGACPQVPPTPDPESNDASIKSLTIKGVAVTADANNVFAYEVPANENIAQVEVAFVLADKATADKTSPFNLAVPESSEAAASEATINVTAEDGTTKKAYKVSVTRAAAEQGIEDVLDTKKTVKFIEDGQIVIIKNGVKYNVLGTQIR